jgi:uncharacterized phiE125 gp8 family phage protein
MLAPVRTVAPAALPVSLVDAKAHLRVIGAAEDVTIEGLIATATEHLDGWSGILGRALVTQSWRQDFGSFDGKMRLALKPAASVTSITYFDGSNVQQTLPGSVYQLFTDARGPYVALQPDQSWPGAHGRDDAVSVTYVAGSPASEVPAPIRHAILLMVGHFYENREAIVVGTISGDLPLGVDRLLAPYRRVM